jgi:Zn-finger nucleic acid-binding protein
MDVRRTGGVEVHKCEKCEGIFLPRIELGALVEAENDWHAHLSADTAQLPRITGNMTAPPPTPARSRSYIEALFRG